MTEEVNFELDSAKEAMGAALQHLEKELTTVRAGKANPSMLNNVKVDYYGTNTPISQVASVSNLDGRTLSIKPWEKPMLQAIEKAIFAANLGVTPQNDGEVIRISIPPMTQERRKDLVKQIKEYGEHAKVSMRNSRRDALQSVKQLVKDGLSEDLGKDAEGSVQEITQGFGKKVDALIAAKEKEVLSI